MANDRAGGDRFWSAGAALELWYGLAISARYRDDGVAAVGLRFGLGESAVQTGRLVDLRGDGGESSRGLYSVSLAGFQGDGFAPLKPRRPRYLHLKLDGPVRYRRHALFDRSRTLLSLLSLIERARTDPGIRGVALNLSGIRIGYENSWELRQQLQALRDDGKRVVVYIDHAGLRLYHLASVADRILFDPSGLLMLEGFVAGGTYLKGALDRIGVGVEELRYREYKSALEPLVRDSMSAEDREQWQAFVDDVYASARADIAAARGLEMEEVDRLVDEVTLFLPEDARGHGLVDTLARWDAVDAAIESLEGRPVAKAGPASIAPRRDRSWGEPPRLAVLYALGVCAMDTGIGARRLVADIERVREDGRVKAVVLRVDSPGGEVLASDLVADAVRRLKEEKPVIVSQGAVAASGGYWISMYADSIVAAPVTLTGSIGVIYGWFYNRGLKEKLGLATDHVRAGARADLPFGMELPLLGTLPDRNLRDDERAIVSAAMRATYDRFRRGSRLRPRATDRSHRGGRQGTHLVGIAGTGGRAGRRARGADGGAAARQGARRTEAGPACRHRRAPPTRPDRLGPARPEPDRPATVDHRISRFRRAAALPPGAQGAAPAARLRADHLVVYAGRAARGMRALVRPRPPLPSCRRRRRRTRRS